MTRSILYIGDPMCSWCWGFSPVIDEIADRYGDRAPVSIVVGGLHAYETAPMDEAYKATIRHHWEQVAEATGQIFSYGFFEREGFVLDTEPACRAAVAMRRLAPAVVLDYYAALHRAFYVENRDTTDGDTLAAIAEGFGVTASAFADEFAAPAVVEETRADFAFAQKLGVTGFPTVIVEDQRGYALLTAGYRPLARLRPALEAWLADD
jgi:putative protein-disulfide isomerase